MAETKTILVAGATGQQGGTVARSLLKRGHRVIGLTRNSSKLNALAAAGIEGVQGDLTQRASLTPLLRNMEVPLPPATRQQLVAVKDIGEFVARAVDDPKAAIGKTVELAGEELAFGDLPAALSKKLGHPIRYVEQPEEEARKTMGDDGFRMFQFFKTIGYQVDIPALEAAWGYRMTRFQDFLDAVDWQRLGTGP